MPTNPTTGSDVTNRNADRRDARSRANRLAQLFNQLNVDDALAQQIVADLSSLLPPQHRISHADDVTSRLKALIERDSKAPAGLGLGRTGVELNIESNGTVRSQEKLDELLENGDERLLQAFVANERLRGVLATQVAEHEAMRNALVGELARRYTVLEQWRYKLPKSFMPLIAVLLKAKVKRDELRLGETLLNDIIDVVATRSECPETARDELLGAAQNAVDQFAQFDPDGDENNRAVGQQELAQEPFEVAEDRLRVLHQRLHSQWRRNEDEVSKNEFRPVRWLKNAAGGLDEYDRPVFKNVEDFEAAVRYIFDLHESELRSNVGE